MASNSVLIHKLQQALNTKGYKILYSTSQFYSNDQNRPITVYHIKQSVYDEGKNRNTAIELFKSVSQIRVVLFLRDLWYESNGWEVPKDNTIWNETKSQQVRYSDE